MTHMRRHTTGVLLLAVGLACEGRLQNPTPVVMTAPGSVAPTQPPQTEPGGPFIVKFDCAPASLVVGQLLSCSIQGGHPDSLPLRCQLDFGNGLQAKDLGDCTTAQSQSITYDSTGMRSVTLSISDSRQKRAMQTLSFEVAPKPNQKPTIKTLTATPKTGTAPLKTQLQFETEDGDGDALTCAVDVGNDGTVEFATVDCSKKTQDIEVAALGVTVVKLIVTDAKGLSAEETVSVETRMPQGDLSLKTIEFGQTVVLSDLRLVEGKTALLKVSAVASKPNLTANVEVEAKMGATVLGKQVMKGPATIPTEEAPTNLSQCFQLMLPAEWVSPGVELTVTVDPENSVVEDDERNNQKAVPLKVGRGNVLHLTQLAVESNDGTGALLDVVPALLKAWPFKSVEYKTRPSLKISGSLSSGNSWGSALQALAQLREADNSRRNYLGMVKIQRGQGSYIAGIGYIGNGAALSVDFDIDTVVHELGHNLNLDHAPCGGPDEPDPNFPSKQGYTLSTGFDGTKLIFAQGNKQVFDVMTYCQPVWVSAYNYAKVQTFVEGKSQFAPGALAFGRQQPVDTVLVSGSVGADGATINPLMRMETVPSEEVNSDTQVQLFLGNGQVLSVPVTLAAASEGGRMSFATAIGVRDDIVKVVLRHGVDVLAEAKASRFPMDPTASVERIDRMRVRVRWSGGTFATVAHLRTPDTLWMADALNFESTLHTTLALAVTGGETVVNVGELGPGSLEVSISDGVRSKALRLALP
jgi:PKD repeat protein